MLPREAVRDVKASDSQVTYRSDLIQVGQQAPDFSASLSDGSSFSLSALRGSKRVVIVFYPGDNTPVCTAQLCTLRDNWRDFQAADALVYGVNPASVEAHARFVAKHNFPFPLIADIGGRISADYGCRMLFGLIKRTVYVIDRLGRIAYARRGNPTASEIAQALGRLQDDYIPALTTDH